MIHIKRFFTWKCWKYLEEFYGLFPKKKGVVGESIQQWQDDGFSTGSVDPAPKELGLMTTT